MCFLISLPRVWKADPLAPLVGSHVGYQALITTLLIMSLHSQRQGEWMLRWPRGSENPKNLRVFGPPRVVDDDNDTTPTTTTTTTIMNNENEGDNGVHRVVYVKNIPCISSL